nr:MAG TPA: hypothetical protein [Caudoviricetes sp.]
MNCQYFFKNNFKFLKNIKGQKFPTFFPIFLGKPRKKEEF